MDQPHDFTIQMPCKPWLKKPPEDDVVAWCSCGHWYLTLAAAISAGMTTKDIRDAHVMHTLFATIRCGGQPDPTVWGNRT